MTAVPDREKWTQVHVHGGLVVRADGSYSSEAGIDPERDVRREIDRLATKSERLTRWLAIRQEPVAAS